MWVIPVDETRTDEELDAAVDFMAFLHANDGQWARTGHLPVRQSVIDSPAYAALPHRESYAAISAIAQVVPRTDNQRGIDGVLSTEFNAMWLSGTDPQAALDAAQTGVERILRRSPG